MKGLDISEENLEDLLAYDDLFSDYFNSFLALPAFPQPLQYDRLAGNFREVPGTAYSLSGSVHSCLIEAPIYGATDEERERQLQWAKEERLPLFLKTNLFREFKLSKLLLRPLDDRYSARRLSSRNIRGYSRQTDSYLSSFTNSAGGSEGDELNWADYKAALYQYERPGSRAFSLPPMPDSVSGTTRFTSTGDQSYSQTSLNGGLSDAKKTNLIKWHNMQLQVNVSDLSGYSVQNGKESSVVKDVTFSRHETLVSIHEDSSLSGSYSENKEKIYEGKHKPKRTKYDPTKSDGEILRAFSAPLNYKEFQKQPAFKDFDLMFGEDELEDSGTAYVTFEDGAVNEDQTEADVKNLLGKHHMTYQEMKEESLASVSGLKEFLNFLSGTAGKKMADFWLECEYFKDSMEDYDEVQHVAARNRLFRDIKDKYRLNLTSDAHEMAQGPDVNLSHTVFIRTQYDVLRRLRTYWVPRFIIHKGRIDGFRIFMENDAEKSRPGSRMSGFFPSISLVNSIPVKPEDILQVAHTMDWNLISKAGRQLDSRVKSAKRKTRDIVYETQVLIPTRTIREILVLALTCDKAAGGVFKRHLENKNNHQLLSNMLFWQDVTEYGMAEDRSADRLLRMCQAWDIFTKFIAADSPFSIGVTQKEQNSTHKTLTNAKDYVSVSVFDTAKEHSVDLLEQAWIRYLKEDLKTFLECSVSHHDTQGPPGTADDIEVFVQNGRIIVRRPIRRMTPLHRGLLVSAQESINSAEREDRRRKAFEKRRIMEKERRKAVRAARQRLKELKLAKSKPTTIEEDGENEEGEEVKEHAQEDFYADLATTNHDEIDEASKPKKPVTFFNMSKNKGLMAVFKKYLTEHMDRKDIVNMINLYHELHSYQGLGVTGSKTKRDSQATIIYRTFLDPKSKKAIFVTEKITARLGVEKDRPRSPTLREITHMILPQIEDAFKEFWQNNDSMLMYRTQAEQMGITAEEIASLSASELAMKLGDPDLKTSTKNRRMRKTFGVTFRQDPDLYGIDLEALAEQMSSQKSVGMLKLSVQPVRRTTVYRSPRLRNPFVKEKTIFGDSTFLSATSSETQFAPAKSALVNRDADQRLFKSGSHISFSTSKLSDSAMDNMSIATKSSYGLTTSGNQTQQHPTDKKPKKKKKKAGGRAQPSKEDKIDFLLSLNQSAMGHLPLHMLYYYRYLQRWGEEDNFPMLDKDLLFYIEVQKFKECSHAFANEELLKKKVQAISDTFLESAYPPPLQIDVPQDLHQKMVKTAQRYWTGKEITQNLFDEAQYLVFKELLPYWAGFKRQYTPPEDPLKRPLTKNQRILKKRFNLFETMPMPKTEFKLPKLPEGPVGSMTFSLTEGVKWKDRTGEDFGQPKSSGLEAAGGRVSRDHSIHSTSSKVASIAGAV